MSRGDELVGRMRESGVLDSAKLRGCTAKQIASLEAKFGRALPAAYREFLSLMGREAGWMMRDVEVFYPEVAKGNEKAKAMLMFDDDPLLPETAFVFATRYGEQFLFFEVDGKDPDPPIYHYFENRDSFRRVYDSIWDFVEDELELTASSPTWHRAPAPAPAKSKGAKKKTK